jgi:poly(A) polymerase
MFSFASLPCPETLEFLTRFSRSDDHRVYLVGGAVRDLLLNRSTKDLDFVLEGHVKPFARQLANTFGGDFFMLDNVRDMARVILYPPSSDPVEFDFSPLGSGGLEADLRSRDFTINAMALDMADFQHLIDPLGGAQDLLDKSLHPCSDSAIVNDPVRILRAARLAVGFGLRIDSHILRLLRSSVSQLDKVSVERQRDELFKIFQGSHTGTAIRLLDNIGVITYLLPELDALKGIQQSPPHILNVWEHTIKTLDELEDLLNLNMAGRVDGATENLKLAIVSQEIGRFRQQIIHHFSNKINPNRNLTSLLVFSALYHDTGKPATRQAGIEGRTRFLEHEKKGADLILYRGRALMLNQAEIIRLQTIVMNHMRIHLFAKSNHLPSNKSIYRYFRQTGEAGVEICLLSLANILATYGTSLPVEKLSLEAKICGCLLEAKWEKEDEIVSPKKLIDGFVLQRDFGMTPGPRIRELLEAIKEGQTGGDLNNLKDAYLFIEEWLNDDPCKEERGKVNGQANN